MGNIKHIYQLRYLLSVCRYKPRVSQWSGEMSFETISQTPQEQHAKTWLSTRTRCSHVRLPKFRQAAGRHSTSMWLPTLPSLLPYTIQNESCHLFTNEQADRKSFRISKRLRVNHLLKGYSSQRSWVRKAGLWLCVSQLLGRTRFEATYWKYLGSGVENKPQATAPQETLWELVLSIARTYIKNGFSF